MKKAVKIISFIVAPAVLACGLFAGCKSCKGKKVDIENKSVMQDIDVYPTVTADYEQYSVQAYNDYKAVAGSYRDGEGEIDILRDEVIAAAIPAAAKLYAYACYNERTLDRYVFFSDMEGTTDLGSNGKAVARRQEYYLRVNEQPLYVEEGCKLQRHNRHVQRSFRERKTQVYRQNRPFVPLRGERHTVRRLARRA